MSMTDAPILSPTDSFADIAATISRLTLVEKTRLVGMLAVGIEEDVKFTSSRLWPPSPRIVTIPPATDDNPLFTEITSNVDTGSMPAQRKS